MPSYGVHGRGEIETSSVPNAGVEGAMKGGGHPINPPPEAAISGGLMHGQPQILTTTLH